MDVLHELYSVFSFQEIGNSGRGVERERERVRAGYGDSKRERDTEKELDTEAKNKERERGTYYNMFATVHECTVGATV